jgi:excisionase family DNA binding protein
MRKANTSASEKVKATERATLSVHESTQVTGFGVTHTYRLLRKGVMPSIRVGKQFFIPRTALLRWLDSCGEKTA